MLKLSDSMAKLAEEEKLYSFTSFIAEFGGALGLFVGFSFLTFFDLYESFIQFLRVMKK